MMGRYAESERHWARAGADGPALAPRRDASGMSAMSPHLPRDPLGDDLIAACTGLVLLRRLRSLVPGG